MRRNHVKPSTKVQLLTCHSCFVLVHLIIRLVVFCCGPFKLPSLNAYDILWPKMKSNRCLWSARPNRKLQRFFIVFVFCVLFINFVSLLFKKLIKQNWGSLRIDKSLGLAVVGKIAPNHGPVEGCAKHPIIYRVSAILLVDLRGLSNHISSGCQWMVGVLPGMLPRRLVKLTLIDYCQLCISDGQFLILVVLFFWCHRCYLLNIKSIANRVCWWYPILQRVCQKFWIVWVNIEVLAAQISNPEITHNCPCSKNHEWEVFGSLVFRLAPKESRRWL